MSIPEYDLKPCREYEQHRLTQRHAGRDCTANLTAEEQAWEDGGRKLDDNPIVTAFIDNTLDVLVKPDTEGGLCTTQDVVERWVWYLAEGEQEVSWYEPVLVQANEFMRLTAVDRGVEYRPGMTKAAS